MKKTILFTTFCFFVGYLTNGFAGNVLDFKKYPLKKEPVTGIAFPTNMPAIHFPYGYNSCSQSQKNAINVGWAMGHYYTWRAKQLLDFIASEPANYRANLWNQGFSYDYCKTSLLCWSPRAWFGPYDATRLLKIRAAVTKVFTSRFLAQDYNFKVSCDISETMCSHTVAMHPVLGTIKFCPSYSGYLSGEKGSMVIHEILHWMTVPYDGQYVADIHTLQKPNCELETQKWYGRPDAFRLANTQGCTNYNWNYNRALINNDNYTYFAYILGSRIDQGLLNKITSY